MRRQDLPAGIGVYRFERLPAARVDAVVSTRHGGVSQRPYESLNLGLHVGDRPESVVENRRRLFAALGLPLERSVWCRQVHEDSVRVVDVADAGRGALGPDSVIADTDALVTDVVDLPLAVIVADCVPVVVYDPEHHVLGIAHAGWAGTVRRITRATVATMRERWGSDPARLQAAIGPSIGPEDYEVGEDVASAAQAAFAAEAEGVLRQRGDGKYNFDLWAANRIDLLEAGVPESQIETAEISSLGHGDFYSHRGEGVTGRFAAVACLRSA